MTTHMKIVMTNHILTNIPLKKGVVIGSFALGTRYAKDIDIICMKEDLPDYAEIKDDYVASFMYMGRRVECLLADKQKSLFQVYKYYPNGVSIATLHTLLVIKGGHIVFPHRQWEKHIQDYHMLLKMVTPSLASKDFMREHRKCTKERLNARGTPKLIGRTKEDFFDDKVVKYYVHDNIHKAIAHIEGKPMYELMQKDTTLVECHKEMWDEMTHEQKVKCVLEEAYVIALERHIIPVMMGQPVKIVSNFDAFKWALMRICTTLCSGWFREFSIENYFEILNSYDPGYVEQFEENIDKYEQR